MAQGTVQSYKVGKSGSGARVDIYLAAKFPDHTRSSLKGLFDKELVTVGRKALKPSYKLKIGDTISINTASLFAEPKAIEIPILYEDEDVIVLNKPAGMLTHNKGALNIEATVASFIKPKLTDKNLKGNRAGIVHRLDRATSGVIIAAKNEAGVKYIQNQFSTRKVNKVYQAIVEGNLKLEEAIIDAPIERNPKNPQTFRVGSNGRQATTHYKTIKQLRKPSGSYSLIELSPKSGRTHQLRVHLKYLGHPIVGDHVYGREGEHIYLYAKSLDLALPNGKQKKFVAPQPKIFNDFLKL